METCRLVNQVQVEKYIKHNVKPIDIEYDPKSRRLVYIFRTEDTKEVWELWKNKTLK